MKVTVLLGGPSAEREVSLVSGRAVADGLRQMGHDVFESDISPTDLRGLDHPADVIFPVLHGEFGESGAGGGDEGGPVAALVRARLAVDD